MSPTRKRTYRKRRRAEQEEETRLRITEAAVDLHGSVGPARTTVSAIAERAGVQRATVYRHFPDEEALFAACSSHWAALNPPPDPTVWAQIADPDERLRRALSELYSWYGDNRQMLANTSRDRPLVPAMRRRGGGVRPLLRGRRRGVDPRAARAGGAPPARAGRDRPRARVRDLALAGRRAGPLRRPGG